MRFRKTGHRIAAALMVAALMLSAPASTAYASSGKTSETAQVEEMCGKLPEKGDLTEKDAGNVKNAMEAYWDLSLAEQASMDKDLYKRLADDYNTCVAKGYVEDAEKEKKQQKEERERAARQQAGLSPSEGTVTDTNYYVFKVTPDASSLSVVIRYTTDINGDGYGDMPSRIILTSPDGESFPLSNSKESEKNDSIHVMYQWQDSYVQLDIASAMNGNWKIETSDPVVISAMPYAGIRQEIAPADNEKEEDADTELTADGEEIPAETSHGPGFSDILLIIAFIGAIVFLLFLKFGSPLKKSTEPKKKGRRSSKDDDADYAKPPTDDEVAEQMRREFLEKRKKQEQEDADDEEEDGSEEGFDDDDDDDDGIIEYNEGESGLLGADNNPFKNGGGFRDDDDEEEDDFFDDDDM